MLINAVINFVVAFTMAASTLRNDILSNVKHQTFYVKRNKSFQNIMKREKTLVMIFYLLSNFMNKKNI